MRREAGGDEAAVGFLVQRIQFARIERDGRRAFHQRQELAAVEDDIGVAGVVALALNAGVRRHRIAEDAEQAAPGGLFEFELLGLYPAVAHRDAAIRKLEGEDHAVAIEPVIIALTRWIERIGAVAIEHAGEIVGQRALHDQIGRIGLEPDRRVMAGKIRVIEERFCHDPNILPKGLIAALDDGLTPMWVRRGTRSPAKMGSGLRAHGQK